MSLVRLKIKGISYSQTQNGAYALILNEVEGDHHHQQHHPPVSFIQSPESVEVCASNPPISVENDETSNGGDVEVREKTAHMRY